MASDGASSGNKPSTQPKHPGRIAKMVRMASEIFTVAPPQRTVSYTKNYGATGQTPGESALADEDEETWVEEEVWGNFRLALLTLGLAGAQLTWTIELGCLTILVTCEKDWADDSTP